MNKAKGKLLESIESAKENLSILSLIFRKESPNDYLDYEKDDRKTKEFNNNCFKKLKKDLCFLNKKGLFIPTLFENTKIKSYKDLFLLSQEIRKLKYSESKSEKAFIIEEIIKDDFRKITEYLDKISFLIEKDLPLEINSIKKQNIKKCGDFSFNLDTGEIEGKNLNTQFKLNDRKYKILKLLMNNPNKVKTYKEIAKIYKKEKVEPSLLYKIRDDIRKIKISLKILPKNKRKNKDIFHCNRGYHLKCN